MSNGLATIRGEIQPRYGWDEIQQMAEQTARSGLFKMSAPQILVLMMIAESEGVHPIRALLMYDIIDGKPALKAVTMAAKFQQAGGVISWQETTNEAAEATFAHAASCPGGIRVRYTIDDARLAGLTHKDNWKKDPESMLVARCISRGVRRCLPGVIMGIYEPDEIPEATPSVEQTARGRVIDALKRRIEKPAPIEIVNSQGEVIEPPTPQSEPLAPRDRPPIDPPPKPPAEPGTPWGRFIAAELAEWNVEREKLASEHTDWVELRKAVTPLQVINHLVKISVGTDQSSLKTNGKRDPEKLVAFMSELWNEDDTWVQDETRGYLVELVHRAQPKGDPQPALPMA